MTRTLHLGHVVMVAVAVLEFGQPVSLIAQTRADGRMTPHQTPADTGRMAWGHHDYARYTTPDPCDRAVDDVTAEVWRTHAVDTLPYNQATDTLPTAATLVAHACGVRFTVAGSASGDLWSLFRLSLALNNDPQADAAFHRLLTEAHTTPAQANVLETAIQFYLGAHPARLAPAQALLKQLDALGPSVLREQFDGHYFMLIYWHRNYNQDSIRVHATTAVALEEGLPSVVRYNGIVAPRPYQDLLWLAVDAQDLEKEGEIIARALREVGGWADGHGQQIFSNAQGMLEMQEALKGKQTHVLSGTYWYNTGGTGHPAPGVVSLIVHVDHTCIRGPDCYKLYTLLRDIHKRYGATVDLTLVTDTRGYSIWTGPLEPAAEAALDSAYFIKFLKLPVALLVDQTPISKRSDGHLQYGVSPIGQMFDEWSTVNSVLIDRAGQLQWVGALGGGEDKRMVEAAIDRVVGPAASVGR